MGPSINRRRLLQNYVGAGFELFPGGLKDKEVLNTFAYTCGFSVCAAVAGARTTSLDLSKKPATSQVAARAALDGALLIRLT